MHEPVIDSLEEILGGKAPAEPAEAHLRTCTECREELASIVSQSQMFQALRVPAEVEPGAGFYGRVINRIDREAKPSIWSLFADSLFARRLAFASVSLTVLLGTWMFSASGPRPLITNAPETIMADDSQYDTVSNSDPDRDRDAVLVHLATYEAD